MSELFAGATPRAVQSVATLVHDVAETLARRFGVCAVRGEISGFSRAPSGHCYFNLKDADGGAALVRCTLFRRAASLTAFAPADGQLVELRGRLGVYEPRGELQLVVESMQRAGAGALYEQFLRTKARLDAEGLFDVGRKRALPAFPRRLGVITSLSGAVLHDVVTTLARRAPHVEVVVYPCLVQGIGAPAALCAAIGTAGRRGEVDALIICRGGGSLEDLWAFNDEQVVRAIVNAPMPVVCGVGHETDVTLADLAADLRAPTPTAAAELAAPPTQSCLDDLSAFLARMQREAHDRLDRAAQHLDRISMRLARPDQGVRQQAQRLGLLAQRLMSGKRRAVDALRADLAYRDAGLKRAGTAFTVLRTQHLHNLEGRLRVLDPKQVLARGYAWLVDGDALAVTSARRLTVGARLTAVLSDGSAMVAVEEVTVDELAPGRAKSRL